MPMAKTRWDCGTSKMYMLRCWLVEVVAMEPKCDCEGWMEEREESREVS